MTQSSQGRAEQCTGSLLRYHESEGKKCGFSSSPGFWCMVCLNTHHHIAVGAGLDNGKLEVEAFVKYTNSEPRRQVGLLH